MQEPQVQLKNGVLVPKDLFDATMSVWRDVFKEVDPDAQPGRVSLFFKSMKLSIRMYKQHKEIFEKYDLHHNKAAQQTVRDIVVCAVASKGDPVVQDPTTFNLQSENVKDLDSPNQSKP